MAKDRIEVCKNYESEGNPCKKKRVAKHKKYCQRCDEYNPRARRKHRNVKKDKVEKMRKSEVHSSEDV